MTDDFSDLKSLAPSSVPIVPDLSHPESPGQNGSVRSVPIVPWEQPVPLDSGGKLPDFPIDAFPSWVSDLVREVTRAMQVPSDLPGCLAVACLAAAAGGRAEVEIRPGRREPLNLYVTSVLAPGERKSPVFRQMTQPLIEWEEQAVDNTRPQILEARTRAEVAEDHARQMQRLAGGMKDADRDDAIAEAIQAAQMAEACTVPSLPRLLADDVTPEALITLLCEQGRAALMSDEGGVFSMMAGRYTSKGVNLDPYLKGWDGGMIRVDRKGRPTEFVRRPAVTMGLTIQPSVLRAVATNDGFRGQGLLARFLWSVPESIVGWRESETEPIDEEVESHYKTELHALTSSLSEWTYPNVAVLPFSKEAAGLLVEWDAELEPRLRYGNDLAHIRDWVGKLVGHTARIAGLIHLAGNVRTGWGHQVMPDSVDKAVEVARYFLDHAIAAFDHMGASSEVDDARALLRWVAAQETFTQREAQRGNRSRFPKAEELTIALGVLEQAGWIRRAAEPEKGPKGGRKPGPTYEVNPKAKDKGDRRDTTPLTSTNGVGQMRDKS